ncbi:hypothetical protein QTO34_004585 [Cnephaeus nilssonii]|uniref:Atg6 BARA domain-containing protein n=1 Tax=Cnephaeus nilssonii TaxID=3371016 RepID=A0AA40LKI6_CNENI|nr:hypothetical protein QTO34_004585 [Eptesicus nilssonii]
MVAFLDCIQQFKEEVEKSEPALWMPYTIHTGEGLMEDPGVSEFYSIRTHMNKEEQQTKALKLMNFKGSAAQPEAGLTADKRSGSGGSLSRLCCRWTSPKESLTAPPPRSLPPLPDTCRLHSAAAELAELTPEAGKRVRGHHGTEAYSAVSQCYCPWAWPQPGPLERQCSGATEDAGPGSSRSEGRSTATRLTGISGPMHEDSCKNGPSFPWLLAPPSLWPELPFPSGPEPPFCLPTLPRGPERDKALEMGDKYPPDWTPDSTHLICAFANILK